MWERKKLVSLLMAHGHPFARRYPLGMLMDESRLVVQRVNNSHATQATLVQMAIAGVLSKKGNKAFSKQIKKLMEE